MDIARDGAGGVPARFPGSMKGWSLVAGLLGLLSLAACAAPPANVPGTPSETGLTAEELTGHRLTGLEPNELLSLLGEPNLRRSDPPAELWQYRDAGCVLELYLYRDGDAYRVVRAETRGRSLQGGEGCTAQPRPTPASLL